MTEARFGSGSNITQMPGLPRCARTSVGIPCRRCSLFESALCRAVASDAVSDCGPVRVRRFEQDETVLAGGDAPELVGILRRGLLRRVRVNSEGRRNVLMLLRPADLLGLLESAPLDYAVEAATDVEICVFDSTRLRHAINTDRILRREVLAHVADQHERQLQAIWQRGALTSRERILAFLVTATEFMPVEPEPDGSLVVSMELTRRDWADLVGTTLETICRVLGRLSDEGLVTPDGPQRYRIRDIARLARLAGIESEPEGQRTLDAARARQDALRCTAE